ncbi:SMC-Scp complex subunit ScpB [Kutzneria sp. NPDC051319]|uniref:SMC-Scp complex subunit ScpB n=1 Tax=Kutzneria sp. NPDC051319 TaxID=3155047 RepID=UPI003412EE30
MTEPEDEQSGPEQSGEEQFEGAAGGGAAKPAPAEVEQPEDAEPETEEPEAGEPQDAQTEPEAVPEAEVPAEPEPPRSDPEPEAEEPEAGSVDVAAVMGAVLDEAAAAQQAEAGDEDEALPSDRPDLTDDAVLHAALESLLLVVDSPAEDELLAGTLEQPVKRIREAMQALSARYTESGSGIDLRRVGDGWRMHTRDTYAPYVEKLLLDGQRAKLTRAALETLAVIAYRQPVTRSRVAAVRGVNVDGVIRTLVTRGLIEETGNDPDTGGILYRTTELFLERLGLSSLQDLPPIAPLLPEVDAIDDVG